MATTTTNATLQIVRFRVDVRGQETQEDKDQQQWTKQSESQSVNSNAEVNSIIERITTTLRNDSSIRNFSVGTELQDKNVVQIVIQGQEQMEERNPDLNATISNGDGAISGSGGLTEGRLLDVLKEHAVTPLETISLTLGDNSSFFFQDDGERFASSDDNSDEDADGGVGDIITEGVVRGGGGPAAAPILEYVQSWFPVGTVTPEFKHRIESDFLEFTEVFKREARGEIGGHAFGWAEKAIEREDVEGGRAIGFIVARGWRIFEDFQFSTSTESFRQGIPTLYAWDAPHRMWFVERRSNGK